MTTIAAFFPKSVDIMFDRNAAPIAGGKIYFYDAGTTNPRTVYKDDALALAHPSPVLTDGNGRVPNIWIGLGKYKAVIKDAAGALITVLDGLPGATQTYDAPSDGTSGWTTGDLKAAYSDAIQDGWALCNGKTIGSGSSGGTARANADVQSLYTLLWNIDATLVVSGGRGASAAADFAASKTIALPDLRGRAILGVDGMGNGLAGILTSASTATPDVIGTKFGAETVTLATAQLPVHTPAITIAAAGGHTPTGTVGAGGTHTPTGTINSAGAHTHPIETVAVNGTSGSAFAPFPSGTSDISTDAAGAHTHVLSMDTVANHTHTFTGDAVTAHTHTATSSAIGSGQAHSNVQPGILAYIHIKI